MTNISFAVTIAELKPQHPRPFLLPDHEKDQILNLIDDKDWAKQEFQQLQQKAQGGDGYRAAFLFALTGEPQYLQTARDWLIGFAKAGGDLGGRALKVNDEFFKQGMPWLGDVFYSTSTDYLEAYDFIHSGLTESEKNTILKGINASADFRLKAMDAWWQTANLVFKPTSMVAIAGLVTQNPKHLEWGFFRKPQSNLGGYFSALNNMLADNGPWLEAPIYAISHLPLYQSLKVSNYLNKLTGENWFNKKLQQGSTVKGLMDYYINTTYPAELRADGKKDYRILTFGDGATGQGGDFYLIDNNRQQRDLVSELALAYKISKNPDYAALLKLSSDYQPDLINKPQLPTAPLLPQAPSSIWPDFGLAFLRSDHSHSYWTNPDSIAASLLFRQGYGHGHADALSMTLFAAGQLFYPDYNAIQYENPAIGWTGSSVAHNTVVVDGNNSLIAKDVNVKHDFNDEFRFVQAQVSEPLGLSKKRTLALTADYLLDVFHLDSLIPRTYDFLLHSFGKITPNHSSGFVEQQPFGARYRNIKDFKTTTRDNSWEIDFIIDAARKEQNTNRIINKFANENNPTRQLKKEFGIESLDHFKAAKLSFMMASHANTRIGIGEDPYGLSFLVARREDLKSTTFVSLHSPSYLDTQIANNREVQTLVDSSQGSLVKVITDEYIDLHAISHQSELVNLYDPATGSGIKFKDYALIRFNLKSKLLTTQGEPVAYSIPANEIGNSQDLVDGGYQQPQKENSQPPSIQVNVFPEILILKDFADTNFTISLTNKTDQLLSAKIILPQTDKFESSIYEYSVGLIPAYQTVHQNITLGRYKQIGGVDVLPISIGFNNFSGAISHGIWVSNGPGLIQKFELHPEPVYRIYTFDSGVDFTMSSGFVTRLIDSNNQTVFEDDSLFDLSDGETIYSPATIQSSFTWANQDHASIISEINNLIRWHVLTIQNRFYVRLDKTYTRLDQVFFVFNKNNKNFNWKNAMYLKRKGMSPASVTGQNSISTNAVEIPFANADYSLCIKTTENKLWSNDEQILNFSLTRNDSDQFGFGLCESGTLASWAQ